MQVTTVGLRPRQARLRGHGIDQDGQVLVRHQLRRGELIGFFRRLPPCLSVVELVAAPAVYVKGFHDGAHARQQGKGTVISDGADAFSPSS